MRNRIRIIAATAAIAAGLALAGCSAPAEAPANDSGSSGQQPAASSETKSGTFMGLNDKNVSGSVSVSADAITFSDFSSDEGPDLHVYLTNGTDEAAVAAGMEVDSIDFSAASQTFALSGVDISGYGYVVIHCDKAAAVFGAAAIS